MIAIPPKSPNLNAFAERWVRTVKTECMRNVLILGINGLRRLLTDYVEHYNAERPHQGWETSRPFPSLVRNNSSPASRKAESPVERAAAASSATTIAWRGDLNDI